MDEFSKQIYRFKGLNRSHFEKYNLLLGLLNHPYNILNTKNGCVFSYHILFFIVICVMILFNCKYLLSGIDFQFHRLRLAGLVQSMKNGDLFPKINYVMCMNHGYGVPLFYGQCVSSGFFNADGYEFQPCLALYHRSHIFISLLYKLSM